VVVPFFISDGPNVRQDIPILLGEPERIVRQRLQNGQPPWRNPTERHGKLVWYAPSVGTDLRLAEIILEQVNQSL
jgi:sirohydrochlorin ferrochelatase